MDREQDIHFVYEDGVLKPQEPIDLPDGSHGIAHIRGTQTPAKLDSQDTADWRSAQTHALSKAWDNDEDSIYDKL